MAQESYKVSVPGSMMLMGEHAVLHGHQAIVCAVQKRIYMQLIPHKEDAIIITDSRLGTLSVERQQLQVQEPFKFVLASILLFKDQLPSGFTLTIDAEFNSVLGLGSSAAVTTATIGVLSRWLHAIPLSNTTILQLAKQVLLQVQGRGSGADLAASLYGGVLAYTLSTVQQLEIIPNLTAIYSGYKTKTADVIAIVEKQQKQNPDKFALIYQQMHACALQAIHAINSKDWTALGSLFSKHHAMQVMLHTSDKVLDRLVSVLEQHPSIYGAKISGAGLGDCVIGLGTIAETLPVETPGAQQFSIVIDKQGLIYASN